MQIRLDPGQEPPGLRPLDDPVIVGRGHRHDLLRADRLSDPLKSHRVGDRPGRDDRALTRHQPRDGGDRAEPPGVGEAQVPPGQVIGRQCVRPRLLDQLVVGVEELGEALATGIANHGHHQRPGAVLALDVDREPEVGRSVVDPLRLAVHLRVVVGHHRHLLGRDAGDRVGDQMREGDAVAGRLELIAPLGQRGHGERPERGRGGDRAALVHVADQRRGAALDQLGARRSRCGF